MGPEITIALSTSAEADYDHIYLWNSRKRRFYPPSSSCSNSHSNGYGYGLFFLWPYRLVFQQAGPAKNGLTLLCSCPDIYFSNHHSRHSYWQYFYGGTYQPLIVIKMVLAAVLVILLGLSIKMNRGGTDPKTLFIVYVFCLVCATGLGFSGGELVYGG